MTYPGLAMVIIGAAFRFDRRRIGSGAETEGVVKGLVAR